MVWTLLICTASQKMQASGARPMRPAARVDGRDNPFMNHQSPDTQDTALWTKFAKSVRANTLGEFASQGVRVGGFVALARMLQPSDIGVLRMLIIISMLAALLCEGGISDALVQRRDLQPEHEATGWWLNLGISALVASALYLGAPIIQNLLNLPLLAAGIRLLCVPILFEGLAWTANARLRRRLEFGALAASEVAAEVAFAATALVVLLVFRLPRWSLPMGLAARLLVHALWIYGAERYVPRKPPSLQAAREIGGFALKVASANALQTLSSNVDYILVGRILGSTELGYYSMAWDLLRFITNRLAKVAGRVTLPAFCQLQDSNQRLTQAYRVFVTYMSSIVLPVIASIAVAAPEVLTGVYGTQWLPAATPLRLLAPGLAMIGLTLGMGSVFYAKGRPSLDVSLHGIRFALIIITVMITARFSGLLGVALGMSLVEGATSVVWQLIASRLINLSWPGLMKALYPGIGTAVYCTIVTALGEYLTRVVGVNGALALPFVALPPAAVFLWMEAGTLRHLMEFSVAAVAAESTEL
jgi:PST family polysaccharide transporter